jgi:hypothetical protein
MDQDKIQKVKSLSVEICVLKFLLVSRYVYVVAILHFMFSGLAIPYFMNKVSEYG